jgi:hypothetical protein
MFSGTDLTTCSFDSFDEDRSVMQTISDVATMCSNATLPGMVEPMEETTALKTASVMPSRNVREFLIMQRILCFHFFIKKSSKNPIVLEHTKKSLESDPRMDLIKESTFKKFLMEDRKKSWAACQKAIDSAVHKLDMQVPDMGYSFNLTLSAVKKQD